MTLRRNGSQQASRTCMRRMTSIDTQRPKASRLAPTAGDTPVPLPNPREKMEGRSASSLRDIQTSRTFLRACGYLWFRTQPGDCAVAVDHLGQRHRGASLARGIRAILVVRDLWVTWSGHRLHDLTLGLGHRRSYGRKDAEMEHQTTHDTTPGSPKPLGTRGAKVADTVGRAQRR